MTMQLETRNREAFELVTEALEFIDQYRESRDVARLEDAGIRLSAASEKDPGFFRARYYSAIVDDLSGRFNSAAEKLRALLEQSPPQADEVRYNLGLAEYHGYSHSALERAIEQFEIVLRSVKSKSLRLRAQTGLAQACAMHMIPKEYDKPDLKEIELYRDRAFRSLAQVFRELRIVGLQRLIPFRKSAVDAGARTEISWGAHNAKGMALMYCADYLPQMEEVSGDRGRKRQVAKIRAALRELTRAETIKPDDWANRCDLASANMRLGHFNAEPKRFDVAVEILRDVTERLRPGYGFAIYETGRVFRLKRAYGEAMEHFARAAAVPEEQRDVSASRIETERRRALAGDATFP